MPEHKMRIIDGIRVRPEDVPRFRGRRSRSGPLTASLADPSSVTPPDAPFDPSAVGVAEVADYLSTVGEAEALRVLDAEASGKARVSITSKREQLLAAAAERGTAGNGGDGGTAT